MDVLLLQFCAVAKEKMEHAIVLRMADRFQLQDLVTSPAACDTMSSFSPSYIQDFLRLILLVVRDRRNTGTNEVKDAIYGCFPFLWLGHYWKGLSCADLFNTM
jgi:hypothetical protein